MANFAHFNNDGVDYFKLYIKCPVCLEHGWPTDFSHWYHHQTADGRECGGEMYLGDNGYYYCSKCGHTAPALTWKYGCPNHDTYGDERFLSIRDGKYIANSLSVSGQLTDKLGLIWLNKVVQAFIKQMDDMR